MLAYTRQLVCISALAIAIVLLPSSLAHARARGSHRGRVQNAAVNQTQPAHANQAATWNGRGAWYPLGFYNGAPLPGGWYGGDQSPAGWYGGWGPFYNQGAFYAAPVPYVPPPNVSDPFNTGFAPF